MGCASSTAATTTTTTHYVGQPRAYVQPAPPPPALKITPEKQKQKKHSPRKSSSSSSSSDSDFEDLDAQRKKIKQASAAATVQEAGLQKVVVKEETIRKYRDLNIAILAMERKNISQNLHSKLVQSIELKKEGATMMNEYRKLQEKTRVELQDVENLMKMQHSGDVAAYFETQVDFDAQISKEQEEYIQAKTEMEDAYRKIEAMTLKQNKLEKEIGELQKLNNELLAKYKEQDDMLESLFGDSYGSDLEDQLESQLDQMLDKQQYIEVALQKWKNSLVIVKNAHDQLAFAYNRWVQIMNIPIIKETQITRVKAGGETRSYLIAASQNLANAHQLLKPATVPYCTPAEVATLNRAITYLFVDIMSKGRQLHAAEAYVKTRDRCGMLTQWIDNVIVNRISVDYENCRKDCAETRKRLRAERIRLMVEKVELETGEKIDFDEGFDSGVESESDTGSSDNVVAVASEAGNKEEMDKKISDAKATEPVEEEVANKEEPPPVPLDQLAPTPNNKELFGDLDSIMADYEKQRDEYNQTITAQKSRQQANLKEKLQRRRSRQKRLLNNQDELNKLIEEEKMQQIVEKPTEE